MFCQGDIAGTFFFIATQCVTQGNNIVFHYIFCVLILCLFLLFFYLLFTIPQSTIIYIEEHKSLVHGWVANSCQRETLASLVHGYHKFLDKVNIYPSSIKHIYAE